MLLLQINLDKKGLPKFLFMLVKGLCKRFCAAKHFAKAKTHQQAIKRQTDSIHMTAFLYTKISHYGILWWNYHQSIIVYNEVFVRFIAMRCYLKEPFKDLKNLKWKELILRAWQAGSQMQTPIDRIRGNSAITTTLFRSLLEKGPSQYVKYHDVNTTSSRFVLLDRWNKITLQYVCCADAIKSCQQRLVPAGCVLATMVQKGTKVQDGVVITMNGLQ